MYHSREDDCYDVNDDECTSLFVHEHYFYSFILLYTRRSGAKFISGIDTNMTSLQFKRLMGSIVTKVSGTTPPPLVKPPSKSQTRIGVVHSTKMERTVSVIVERLVKHPKWKKYVRKRKKYKMHHEANYSGNERNWLKPGDVVKMVSTKPKAKTVFWELYASAGGLLRAGRERKLEDIERKIAEKVKLGEIITEDEKSFALSRSKMKSGRGFAAGGGGVEE